jgi:hypothetical protein
MPNLPGLPSPKGNSKLLFIIYLQFTLFRKPQLAVCPGWLWENSCAILDVPLTGPSSKSPSDQFLREDVSYTQRLEQPRSQLLPGADLAGLTEHLACPRPPNAYSSTPAPDYPQSLNPNSFTLAQSK